MLDDYCWRATVSRDTSRCDGEQLVDDRHQTSQLSQQQHQLPTRHVNCGSSSSCDTGGGGSNTASSSSSSRNRISNYCRQSNGSSFSIAYILKDLREPKFREVPHDARSRSRDKISPVGGSFDKVSRDEVSRVGRSCGYESLVGVDVSHRPVRRPWEDNHDVIATSGNALIVQRLSPLGESTGTWKEKWELVQDEDEEEINVVDETTIDDDDVMTNDGLSPLKALLHMTNAAIIRESGGREEEETRISYLGSSMYDAAETMVADSNFDDSENSGRCSSGLQTTMMTSPTNSIDVEPRRKRKTRTAFTNRQLYELERRFIRQKYLLPADRDSLAQILGLTNAQVITWFQNRRAKLKRDLDELRADMDHAVSNNLAVTLTSAGREPTWVLPLSST